MNDNTKLAGDLINAGSKLLTNTQFPDRLATEPSAPKFHKENVVTGETLNDYTDRIASEDGTYVKVIVHKERIDLIEQPPTPEELAQRKDDQKNALKLTAILAGGAVATVVVLGAADVIKARLRSGS